MSSFKHIDLPKGAGAALGEVHGYVDSLVMFGQGASATEIRELKEALDRWCKREFGFVPTRQTN